MIRRIAPYALALLMFIMGCGDATEVGNPTGEVPTTRTIKGVLDPTYVEALADTDIDLTAFTVSAIASDGTFVDGPVDDVGEFTLVLSIGIAYSMEVLEDGNTIGYFSFEQDAEGTRANYLRFDLPGDIVDFGQVRHREGAFRPEEKPRLQQGFHPYPGPPPLDGYDPSSGYQYGDEGGEGSGSGPYGDGGPAI